MFTYFTKSIVRLFNSIILSLITLGLTAFGLLIGYYNYDMTIKDLNSKSQNTVELASISLQGPIWNFDEEAWNDVVKAIFLDKDVTAIEVLSADEEALVSEKRGVSENLSFEEMKDAEGLIVTIGDISKDSESIGKVTVVTSTAKAEQLIEQTSIFIAAFSAAMITLLVLFIWVAGRKIIQNPIGALQDSAMQLSAGNLETHIDTKRKDELGSLAKSFDDMRCSIRKKIVDLNILNQTGETLAATHDQVDAMKTSLRIMKEQACVERGSIYLLKDDHLELYACYPEFDQKLVAKNFNLGEGVAGKCAETHLIQFIPDTAQSTEFVASPNQSKAALLCVPMMDENKLFGVMNFSGDVEQVKFERSDQDFALTIARMAVITTKNIQMLDIIQEQNRTLEHKVQERTAELRQKSNDISNMLQNMRQGIFTITREYKVHTEYSAFLEKIFDKNHLGGLEAIPLLFENTDIGQDMMHQITAALEAVIGEDMMMFDFNSHLLITEYMKTMASGDKKTLELDWNPIVADDDEVEKLMVTVRDVTELRGLQAEAERQKEELDAIGQILSISQKKFLEFIATSNTFVDENVQLIEASEGKDTETIATLFRNMHTIKGNARTYGFSYLTDIVHHAESTYDNLRKDPDAVWDKDVLLGELIQVRGQIQHYENIFDEKLAGFSGTGEGSFIDTELMEEIDHVVEEATEVLRDVNLHEMPAIEDMVQHMKSVLNAIGTETLEQTLESIMGSLPGMASALNKPAPQVVLKDNSIRFSEDIVPVLKDVFMHTFRNSMDHGIELPEDRTAAGKDEQGVITLEVRQEDGQLVFHFHDDGRGLALSYIHQKAITNGLLEEGAEISDEELAQFIFHSGLSTAQSVTTVSGRGVGMDAIKRFVQKQGGDIEISFIGERREGGYRPFEQIVKLPIGVSVKVAKAA